MNCLAERVETLHEEKAILQQSHVGNQTAGSPSETSAAGSQIAKEGSDNMASESPQSRPRRPSDELQAKLERALATTEMRLEAARHEAAAAEASSAEEAEWAWVEVQRLGEEKMSLQEKLTESGGGQNIVNQTSPFPARANNWKLPKAGKPD